MDASGNLYVNRIHALFSTCSLKRNPVTFPDVVDESGDMNEYRLTRSIIDNESKTFGFIKKLYGSCICTPADTAPFLLTGR